MRLVFVRAHTKLWHTVLCWSRSTRLSTWNRGILCWSVPYKEDWSVDSFHTKFPRVWPNTWSNSTIDSIRVLAFRSSSWYKQFQMLLGSSITHVVWYDAIYNITALHYIYIYIYITIHYIIYISLHIYKVTGLASWLTDIEKWPVASDDDILCRLSGGIWTGKIQEGQRHHLEHQRVRDQMRLNWTWIFSLVSVNWIVKYKDSYFSYFYVLIHCVDDISSLIQCCCTENVSNVFFETET